MEEIFVKEWFSKQLRQIFHVYPLSSGASHPNNSDNELQVKSLTLS